MAFINEELLADQSDVRLEADAQLLNSGALNSLGMMRLIMFIETELDVSVPLLDVTPENFASINVLADYLRAQLACHAVSSG